MSRLTPGSPASAAVVEQGELLSRLRAVVEAKDAENQVLRAELEAAWERERRLELRLAELERRLRMASTDSGTPTSKEPIGARERRRAERQESERERRKDRRPGGQPGHPGRALARDPDPGQRKDADPPAQCHRCGTSLDGAAAAAPGWAQVVDVQVTSTVTEWALPGMQYQRLLPQLAGIQQCCQHVIRRCRAVTKLGPGSQGTTA